MLAAIFLILLLVTTILFFVKKTQYEQTEYYEQTGNRFLRLLTDKGIYGEYLTWDYLQDLPGSKRFLFNAYVPKENGETTEIDVILLHESGIYVLESKNYSGWIFGTETQTYWTQTIAHENGHVTKNRFYNPVMQNKGHIKWLSRYLGLSPDQFYSYIVFSDRCTLKNITLTSGQHHVANRYDIPPLISANARMHARLLSPEKINSLYARLVPLTRVSQETKAAHIQNIHRGHAGRSVQEKPDFYRKPEPAREPAPKPVPEHRQQGDKEAELFTCPRCGSRMILDLETKGSHTGHLFFYCPACRHKKYR